MTDVLKVGDGVRVKPGTRIAKYPAGGRGTVSRGPKASASGSTYYLLVMDKDDPSDTVLVKAEDIEPDE
jgi:hypothetical protein